MLEKPPILAPPGTVCRRCWHGLKGLAYGSVCPECGESVGAAMDPLWWGAHDAPGLPRVVRSIRACVWGAAGGVLAFGMAVAANMPTVGVIDPRLSKGLIVVAVTAVVWLLVANLRTVNAVRAAGIARTWPAAIVWITVPVAAAACIFATVVLMFDPTANGLTFALPVITFSCSLLASFVGWAAALRQAAVALNRMPFRQFAYTQAFLAWAAASLYATLLIAPLGAGVLWGWQGSARIVSLLETPFLFVLGGGLLIAPINLLLLRAEAIRFLRAKSAAG